MSITDPIADPPAGHPINPLFARQLRLFRTLLAALTIVAIGLGVAVIYLANNQTDRWKPLADYPTQRILNMDRLTSRTPTIVKVGKTELLIPANVVAVAAKKCNRSADTLTVTGESRWQMVQPRGFPSVQTGRGQRIMGPRECLTKPPSDPYLNPVPQEILLQVATVCEATGQPPGFTINGEEIPHSKGRTGAVETWSTESFRVACP